MTWEAHEQGECGEGCLFCQRTEDELPPPDPYRFAEQERAADDWDALRGEDEMS